MARMSQRFTHDPYSVRVLPESPQSRSQSPGPVHGADDCLPPGTLHTALLGHANFVQYPTRVEDVPVLHPKLPKADMTRLFVGQLPYGTTAEQLQWVIYEASHCGVFFTETIHQWTGDKHSKGCVHTYCAPEDADVIIQRLHRHALIDDSGVWIAESDEEYRALEDYCRTMKTDKTKRFFNRPCQPVVSQRATSTFVPMPRVSSALPQYQEAVRDLSPPPYFFSS